MKTKNKLSWCLFLSFALLLFQVGNRASASTSNFTFGIVGDSEKFNPDISNGPLQKAVKKISTAKSKFIVSMGDMSTSCGGDDVCKTRFTSFKDILKSKFSKYYLTMGDNDRTDTSADDIWQEVFSLPGNSPSSSYDETVYSFNYGNSHFVFLNSQNPDDHDVDSDQRTWLEEDLNNNTRENVFVFFHEPAWPTNSKVGKSLDKNPSERDELWNILSDYKVTAVFSGHEHLYTRKKITVDLLPGVKNEVYQFIVGNTNASTSAKVPKKGMSDYYYTKNSYVLVDVKGKKITVRAYKTNGKLLNKFDFVGK